ncbi:MAG: sugar ABC transporter permease [Chloroflexota bacterium]|nr:sugar ABC transporter permease [Chloroflexota bacterium]
MMKRTLSSSLTGCAFVLPATFFLAVFVIFPVLFNIFISFHRWDIMTPPVFRGLRNYEFLFADDNFWQAVSNTVVFVALAVPAQMGLGLIAAILLNEAIIGRTWLRSIIFSPMVVSMAAAGIMFRWLFNGSEAAPGFVATSIQSLGIDYPNWQLQQGPWAMLFIVLMNTWKSAGYCMIIYIAGLQTIPRDLYEAASVDGVNSMWQKFRYITWPLLTSTTAILLVTTTIFSFRAFDPMFIMTDGGPNGTTTTIIFYIYEKFQAFSGIAAAAATFLLVAVLGLTATQLWITRRQEQAIYG